eukprot:349522_1
MDDDIRQDWKPGSFVQIFSGTWQKWFFGRITQILNDEEGEWIEVHYYKSMRKQVKRFASDLRSVYHPTTNDETNKEITELLIGGYIRSIQNLLITKIIPTDINVVCCQFYFLSEFQKFMDKEEMIRKSWKESDQIKIYIPEERTWNHAFIINIVSGTKKDKMCDKLICGLVKHNQPLSLKTFERCNVNLRGTKFVEYEVESDTNLITELEPRNHTLVRYTATDRARKKQTSLDLNLENGNANNVIQNMETSILFTMTDLSFEIGKLFSSVKIQKLCCQLTEHKKCMSTRCAMN